MKTLFSVLALSSACSLAHSQPVQRPVFFPATETVVTSETTTAGKKLVIERRTIILLGFLPRTQSGKIQAKTGALSSEDRKLRLEAHVKSRDFDGVFDALTTELLRTSLPTFRAKIWKFSVPPTRSGWSFIPSGLLNATLTMGTITYCVYEERFSVEGTRDSKNLLFNPYDKGGALHFRGEVDRFLEGPCMRVMNKGLRFDFQTLPTSEEMEELRKHDFGG